MSDFKKSVQQALEKYSSKTVPTVKRRNQKPEKELQQKITKSLRELGFLVVNVESKAVYSAAAGRYLHSQAETGTSDILLVTPEGYGGAVEVKRPGARSSLKAHQRDFLISVISRGGFGCCSDDLDELLELYSQWVILDRISRINLLKNALPKQKTDKTKDETLFSE